MLSVCFPFNLRRSIRRCSRCTSRSHRISNHTHTTTSAESVIFFHFDVSKDKRQNITHSLLKERWWHRRTHLGNPYMRMSAGTDGMISPSPFLFQSFSMPRWPVTETDRARSKATRSSSSALLFSVSPSQKFLLPLTLDH